MTLFEKNDIPTVNNALIADLNSAQQQAVTAPISNPLLVLAGAGSGKTRVLVNRITWLHTEKGIPLQSILAVTFTNKAANEIKQRIQSILNTQTQSLYIGTFHSLSYRLLKKHAALAQLPSIFQIIDKQDQQKILKTILKDHMIDENYFPIKNILWFINHWKQNNLLPNQVIPTSYKEESYLKIYHSYQTHCINNGLVDFNQLLMGSYHLLINNPQLLNYYQNYFEYILVDEFQDTNALQYEWLKLLAQQKKQIMAVGDDDQSIYSWRGAQVKNLQQFKHDFQPCSFIKLEENYRSTSIILEAANNVIANNDDRLNKVLRSQISGGELINIYKAFDETEEATYIVDQIKFLQQTYQLNNIAIFYRSNAQSRILEDTLLRNNIPFKVYGGQRFFERIEIKNILSYLKLLLSPDDYSFERIINFPPRGIGSKTVDKIKAIAQTNQASLWDTTLSSIQNNIFGNKVNQSLIEFTSIINNLKTFINHGTLTDVITKTLELTKIESYYQTAKNEEGLSRLDNIQELINAATEFSNQYIELTPHESLEAFMTNISLNNDQEDQQIENSVQLMTLHAAKGLEFPVVFITGMEEGLFPHSLAVDEGQLNEERRLCYVGMTRAMKKLFFTYTHSRKLYGRDIRNQPSRFLTEIPQSLIANPLSQSTHQRKSLHKDTFATQKQSQNNHSLLGKMVSHQVFGDGNIIECIEGKPHTKVKIHFKKNGIKTLILAYANLTIL